VDALIAALDALCAVDPASLGDGPTVVELHRQLERLGAVVTRAVAAFDVGRSWEADGAQAASAWLAVRCRVPRESARRRVRLGRDLRHMAVVEAAWLAGDVGQAQVALLASARSSQTAECFARDEAMLVEQAKTLGYRSLVRALAYWSQLADPEGAERSAQRQHADRRLHLSKTFGGAWVLNGLFDPLNGQIIADAVGRIEQELFEADWAEARGRVGEAVGAGDLARTPAQRRADAVVVMAQRALAAPAGARLPEPLFSVLVDYETFARTCELAEGSVVTPGSLVRWLDRAWVERVVFDGPDRIKNVGVRRRLFSGATRRAVELRDRQCFHDFCEVPAEHCEIDHVKPWSEGGLTVEDNGRPACGFHNRQRARPRPPP
jgi:hypothetical protein